MDKAIDTTAKALATISHHVGTNKDGGGPSKSFQILVKMIGEAKTKHEEDRIIKKESLFLKDRIGDTDISSRQMRELLIRLIYCEMLGVECSWGYIHAVKMTQSSSIMEKRTGYLAVSLFLHDSHELNMLLVNTLQRDLKSTNMMLVSMALIIICKLIGSEMIPPLLPLVQEKLLHPKELVRKKAVMVMHHFHRLSPGAVAHLEDDFRRAISDKDPGVMESALILIHDMASDNPSRFKDLVPSFSNIMSQVISRKLPADFDYHSVPAPWIQMRLLRLFAILGADDYKASEELYPILEVVLASAECNSNIGQAISYECIRTITSIYPNSTLIDNAARTIGRFVSATNNNWKYLGINSLASLVQINPKYAAEHQVMVIECLDDPDETLKRKTLDLLYKMTNPSSVTVITDRLIAYLRTTRDDYIRSDLVAKITQLAERFAPDNLWFIQTMNAVFELGGALVRKEVAHNLMRLIAEGTDDEDTDMELRLDAVSTYVDLLDKPHLPDILVKIMCWVIGEYAYLMEDVDMETIIEKVTGLLGSRFSEADTCGWIVTAITKLVSQLGYLPEHVQSHIAVYLTSTSTDIQQRCSELVELSQDISLMQEVLPMDASCEDLEVDASLSFLDGFVSQALAKGASSYKPPHLRVNSALKPASPNPPSSSIKFEPYALPQKGPSHSPKAPLFKVDTPPSQRAMDGHAHPQPQAMSFVGDISTARDHTYTPKEDGLSVKERKWGKTGYNKTSTSPAPLETTPTSRESDSYGKGGGGVSSLIVGRDSDGRDDSPSAEINPVQASIIPPSQEEVKRKQFANQLFGGLSGPSRAPRTKHPRKGSSSSDAKIGSAPNSTPSKLGSTPSKEARRRSPSSSSSPSLASRNSRKGGADPPQVDLLLDLQDIDFSSPSQAPPNVTSHAPPTSLSSLMDGLDVGSSQSLPAPTLPVQNFAQCNENLLDLLDGPTPPLVSDMTLNTASIPAPLDSGGPLALTLFETPITSFRVPQEYSQHPVSSDFNNTDLCQDAYLRVSLTKIFKPDELVLIFNITNQKQDKLSGVTIAIDPPTATKATSGKGEQDLALTFDLAGFANVIHIILLVPSSPAINMSVHGQLSYKDPMSTPRRLFFDTSVYISDIIRPLSITTPEFGKKWGTLAYEKKLKLPPSVTTPSSFMDIMRKKFNFHPVEIIGTEGISAGTFLPSTPCLIHGKLHKSSLDFWVRTPSSLLTESIAKLAQAVFKTTS